MHITTFADKTHFEYLMYVFHKHVSGGGMEPDELAIAAQVWKQLKETQEFDPSKLEQDSNTGEKEIIRVDGPISVVHQGDLEIPIDLDKL